MTDVQDSTDCSYVTLPLFWQRRFPGQSIHWQAGGPAGLPCSSSARQPHLPVPQQPLSFPASPTCCLQPMHNLKCCRNFFSLPVSLARPERATVPASPTCFLQPVHRTSCAAKFSACQPQWLEPTEFNPFEHTHMVPAANAKQCKCCRTYVACR